MDKMEEAKSPKPCCEACGYEIGVHPYQVKDECILACDDCSYTKPSELLEKVKDRRFQVFRKKYTDYEKLGFRRMEKTDGEQ